VHTALDRAGGHLDGIAGRRAVVVGAGSMAGLAVATLVRAGAGHVAVANRTPERAARLAAAYGATAVELGDLATALTGADLLVSCTGAVGVVVDEATVAAGRDGRSDPFVVVDLALPHDVDPAVMQLPGVHLVDLATLAEADDQDTVGAEDVRRIVAEELTSYLALRRAASVTPTVVALRSMASGVVDAELSRVFARLPQLDDDARAEVELAVRRVADKLLHQPTVRVKELANETGAVSYAAALAELFALDPEAVQAVTRPEGVS
jgi:glutamyl-tRNA reductase